MVSRRWSEFRLPEGLTYLNCAYMSPLPRRVEEAGIEGMRRKRVPSEITSEDFFAETDALRRAFGRLINGPPERVAIIPSVSYGLATAAGNCPTATGQNIVLTADQFPSNVYTWLERRKQGVEVRCVAAPTEDVHDRGRLWNERLLDAIDLDTAIVAVPQYHWTDGTRFALGEIGDRAREVGAAFIVDGTQSVGAVPFDIAEFRPDALVCAGYKWLLGPFSLGVAWFGPRFDDGKPLEEAWLSRPGSEDFRRVAEIRAGYRPGAVRYDVGENSNFVLVPMLKTSIELLLEWGVSEIQRHCGRLASQLARELHASGLKMSEAEWRGDHLFGLRLPEGCDAEVLQGELRRCRVEVSLRGSAVRVSPHVYNEEADMAALSHVLSEFVAGSPSRRR